MADLMRPVPLGELIKRIFSEYRHSKTIFDIGEEHFYRPVGNKRITVLGEGCDTPLGPAAGPHTQLTQNIVAAYLTGGRFMELKTVQVLDTLEIEKPCIDADDEGFNTEWSTEFTLPQAYDEYVKGWVLLYLLEEFLGFRKTDDRSFIFNMSVGYDLRGIKTEKMQRFIHGLLDASTQGLLGRYRREVREILADPEISSLIGDKVEALEKVSFPDQICRSATLSTMHGCPPAEIEAICRYLLTEKNMPTFVKLNPTLLGYEGVRKILDNLGYGYITLKQEAFDHDLQYPDAVTMLKGLKGLSQETGVGFGMKLTNTLGIVNDKGILRDDEMYMSGRALYPLSVNLAAKLSTEFDGNIPISFAGGARLQNMKGLFDTGIRPITMATELLKPGGYTRLKDPLELLEGEASWEKEKIDPVGLQRLAEESLKEGASQKDWRGFDKIELAEPLPLFDCYVAPCIDACAIHQDIPEYVQLVGQGRYSEALDLIYRRNALPAITAHICDHKCQNNCTRLDYEGGVQIREMKKIAVQEGWREYRASWSPPGANRGKPVAVVGAGPAGLSAAFFLAREGFPVTIFEKAADAGGVVSNVLPAFRMPREAILQDIDFIKDHGVKFVFGADPNLTLGGLKEEGFTRILLAVGAEKGNPLPMENGEGRVTDALEFLTCFRENPENRGYGAEIVVVGGGNTAMDAARVAKRLPGVKDVTVIYRRTRREMTADKEEYLDALEDGVEFLFLSHPLGFYGDELKVRKMKLGAPDDSGRRRPEPTQEAYSIKATHLVAAIGEKVDRELLKRMGLSFRGKAPRVDPKTCATEVPGVYLMGDARLGPSAIVNCIAEGRAAADHILAEEGAPAIVDPETEPGDVAAIVSRKPNIQESLSPRGRAAFAEREGSRCLECNTICNKCVEVCPNRANIALELEGFHNPYQILHIDAYCNECGNCGTFCPWDGLPYIDKLTIFNREEDFQNSQNSGFLWNGSTGLLRLGDRVYPLNREGEGITAPGNGGGQKEEVLRIIALMERDHAPLLGAL